MNAKARYKYAAKMLKGQVLPADIGFFIWDEVL